MGSPARYLIASMDWIDPTIPVIAPITPASRHVGTLPAGGATGNVHLKHAVSLGMMLEIGRAHV